MSNYIFPDGPHGEALDAVYTEIIRAKTKHPGEYSGHHHGYAIILEEVDELWDDVKKDDISHAVHEAIQVAATAVRFAAELGKYPFTIKPPNVIYKEPELLQVLKKLVAENGNNDIQIGAYVRNLVNLNQ